MSETRQVGTAAVGTTVRPRAAAHHVKTQRTAWMGWLVYAAMMLILLGVFQAVSGLVAIFRHSYYLVTSSGLALPVDYGTWGFVHLALAAVLLGAGFAVIRGSLWGRVVGVVVAGLSAVANLAFFAAYPIWSSMIVALDVVVIYALTVHGSEVTSQ